MPGNVWVISEGLIGRDHPAGSLDRLRAMSRWYAGGCRGPVRGLGQVSGGVAGNGCGAPGGVLRRVVAPGVAHAFPVLRSLNLCAFS
jgi:hypothetical protein